jgi:tetratricopeptide (TPR) repeat protein
MRTHENDKAHGRAASVLLVMAGLLSAPLVAQDDTFELMNAIPDDMFIVTASRPNPDRQFLDDYWMEVWNAFEASGTVGACYDLAVGLADADDRKEIERIKGRFTDLIGAVEWAHLASKETAFGERLHKPIPIHGGTAFIGPPDIVVMLRSDADTARSGFEGSVAILREVFAEIDRLAGTELQFEETDLHGTSFVSINLLQVEPSAPVLPIGIGLHDDVLILTFGDTIRSDVAGLLAGTGDARAISASPRYRAAFGSLPPADDAIEFFDMDNLKGALENYAELMVHGIGRDIEASASDDVVNAWQDDEANTLTKWANDAYRKGDHEKALKLTEAAYEVNPKDSVVLYNLACFNTLVGHEDVALDWLHKAVAGGFHAPNKISHDPDLSALHEDPRFDEAVEAARLEARSVPQGWLSAVETIADRCLASLDIIEYSATVHRTVGYATHSESIMVLADDAEDNAFYPVLAASRPIESFAKHLPKETVSYAVTGGTSLQPLYTFLEDSITETGPLGEKLLTDWNKMQQSWGVDVEHDVLGLLSGQSVQATFKLGAHEEWVWMGEVEDEEFAAEMLAMGLAAAPQVITELSKENPMMAMLGVRSWETRNEELAGFHEVMFGMSQQKTLAGVDDGWLVFGSSPEAVLLTRATAAGDHPNVLENTELMGAALAPEGPAIMVTFTDHAGDAAEAGNAIRSMAMVGGMIGGMIPEPDAQTIISRIIGIVSGLAPVVEAIDFYDTSSSHITFDGQTWRTRSVTHYADPNAR